MFVPKTPIEMAEMIELEFCALDTDIHTTLLQELSIMKLSWSAFLILIGLGWIGTGITISEASTSVKVNGYRYTVKAIVIRDVCVIGGGSSGTYSAIRLRDLG